MSQIVTEIEKPPPSYNKVIQNELLIQDNDQEDADHHHINTSDSKALLEQKSPPLLEQVSSLEELKKTLNHLNEAHFRLEQIHKAPNDELNEFCRSIKFEIDLATERLIERINTFRDDFLTQIDNYEKKCIAENKENPTLIEIRILMDEISKFSNENENANLDDFQEESLIKEKIEKARIYFKKLQENESKHRINQYMGVQPEFAAKSLSNMRSSCLGLLFFHKIKDSPINKKVESSSVATKDEIDSTDDLNSELTKSGAPLEKQQSIRSELKNIAGDVLTDVKELGARDGLKKARISVKKSIRMHISKII